MCGLMFDVRDLPFKALTAWALGGSDCSLEGRDSATRVRVG